MTANKMITLIFLIFSLSCYSEEKKPTYSAATYDTLLTKLKKFDHKIDFYAFRMSYTKTKDYNPYNFQEKQNSRRMFSALAANKNDTALNTARNILAANYTHINAHLISKLVYKKMKKNDLAHHHHLVMKGLIDSILHSGDGKSQKTAYIVTSTTEEYTILNVLGLKSRKQSLIKENGHSYDKMDTINRNGKTGVVYFDIQLAFDWLKNRTGRK